MRWLVLGPVAATAGDSRSDLGGRRQRTVAAVLLAARGQEVSTERLVGGLWVQPPPSARKTLQANVCRLRRDLRSLDPMTGGGVETTPSGYRLVPTACEVDADRFEVLLREVKELRRPEPVDVVDMLEAAEALWSGPPFGMLGSHPLVRDEAQRLDFLRTAAVADRMDARLALGDHDLIVGELQTVVSRDPLDERAQAQLLLALYRSGHQAEAFASYRRLQQLLRDEVGVDPCEQLQTLHEQMLRQHPGLAAPRRTGRAPPSQPAPSRPRV